MLSVVGLLLEDGDDALDGIGTLGVIPGVWLEKRERGKVLVDTVP